MARGALEGKGPQRTAQKRLDRRLEEVAKAVGGGYRRLQMRVRLALAVREPVAGHRLGVLEGGEGGASPRCNASLGIAHHHVAEPPPEYCSPIGRVGDRDGHKNGSNFLAGGGRFLYPNCVCPKCSDFYGEFKSA